MIKITSNIIETIIKHIHWCIWSFCLLYLVFDKALHLPLEFLYNFNFIPEFMLNWSKLINLKPIEPIVPEINVTPSNNDEMIVALKETTLLLEEQIIKINTKFDNLFVTLQDTSLIIKKQLTLQKDLFNMLEIKLSSLNVSKDLIIINSKLEDINTILQIQGNGQIDLASRIISNIKETNTVLSKLDFNLLSINKNVSSLDFNKPILNLQETLSQIVTNQQDLHLMYKSNQDLNLQSFNSLLEMQNLGFQATEENLKEIFSKMYEVRNHNLGLHQQLIKSFDIKLLDQQTEIVNQVIDEINRPKTFSTEASKQNSWSNVFNNKK